MNFSIGEEQYKKILELMLELEKKIETKNLDVRSDFTRELQRVSQKPEVDPEKLQKNVES